MPAAHFRNIGLGGRVELEPPLVAELEDGQRGERLGHRGDSEQAVGGDDLVGIPGAAAERLDVGEAALGDDAPGEARNVLLGAIALEMSVERGADILDPPGEAGGGGDERLRFGGHRGGEQQGGDQDLAHG